MFPFARFPGVDTVLGPEMRSTGEVMGIDRDYAIAFAKSQIGSGTELPISRHGLRLGARRRQGPDARDRRATSSSMGFRLIATRGTRRHLEAHGIACEQVNKVLEGRPHIVDAMKNGERAAGLQHHRGRQGARRQQGHPPHSLACTMSRTIQPWRVRRRSPGRSRRSRLVFSRSPHCKAMPHAPLDCAVGARGAPRNRA